MNPIDIRTISIDDYINFCVQLNTPEDEAVDNWVKYRGSQEVSKIRSANLRKTRITSGNNQVSVDMKKIPVPEIIAKMLSAQEKNTYFPSLEQELLSVSEAYDMIIDKQGKLYQPGEITTNMINKGINSLELYYKQQSALLDTVNSKAGMTGEYARLYRDELTKTNPYLLQLGISFGDLAEASQSLVSQSGRFLTLNSESWVKAGTTAKAYVGELSNLVAMYPEFEKVGLGAGDAQEKIARAGREALGLGLQAQKATKDLAANLGKLNEYGFKNGVEGLASMVRKATEFRMEMSSVFTVAEKVFSPEGALDLAANLQVLGGAIGDFNDPMKLMYMATNNVEGLQDALVGAASSLATYNDEQGRFEVTGVNLRRAKAMATELGISMSELNKIAISSAERTQATSDMMARGLTLSEDQKRFITNISQMKGGKMTIELNSEQLQKEFEAKEVKLEDLTQKQLERLTELQDSFVEKSDTEIVRQQASDIENMKRDMSAVLNVSVMQLGELISLGTKGAIRTATGGKTDRISDYTQILGKNFIDDVKNKGSEIYKRIEQEASEILDFNKRKPEQTAQPQSPNAPAPTNTTNTGGKPNAYAPTNQTQTLPLMAMNTDTNNSLLMLTKKQDEILLGNQNIAKNTLNTANGVAGMNNNLLSFYKSIPNQVAPKVEPTNTSFAKKDIDNLARTVSNIKPKAIDDRTIFEKYGPPSLSNEKKEVAYTHTYHVNINPKNGLADKTARELSNDVEWMASLKNRISGGYKEYV